VAVTYTPTQLARKINDWAKAGMNFAVVLGLQKGLEPDKVNGEAHAPKLKGLLARTIHITKPTLKRAVKTGLIEIKLVAGSKAAGTKVFYASVHQNGFIVAKAASEGEPMRAAEKTRAHIIVPRAGAKAGDWTGRWTGKKMSFTREGADRKQKMLAIKLKSGELIFRRRVQHPGSKFRGRHYLSITVPNVVRSIDAEVQASANREIG